MEIRNTPRPDGRSPAQILFGRPLRTAMPAHQRSFAPEWQALAEECDRKQLTIKQKAQRLYDRSAHILPPLKVGTPVRIQDHTTLRWDKIGTVVGIGRRRDYHIKLPSGRIYWRNRRFLRPYHQPIQVGTRAVQPTENTPERQMERHVRFSSPPPRRSSPKRLGKPVPEKPIPEKPVPEKPIPGKPVPGKLIPGKPVPGKPVPVKPIPGKPIPGKPVPGKPIPGKPVPGKPVPGKPVLGKPVPGKKTCPRKTWPGKARLRKACPRNPVLGKPVPGKPVPGKPILGKPVPGKPVPEKPV
ncbi:protein piccolo-like [Penaeus japonicus]|uniref:protein piccolo-like n=1 Tax=Penaeus japonicus TaxID=27405 RepID=UPI001C70B0DE|nr:protein piccolo-like [Penaeus japonicus]